MAPASAFKLQGLPLTPETATARASAAHLIIVHKQEVVWYSKLLVFSPISEGAQPLLDSRSETHRGAPPPRDTVGLSKTLSVCKLEYICHARSVSGISITMLWNVLILFVLLPLAMASSGAHNNYGLFARQSANGGNAVGGGGGSGGGGGESGGDGGKAVGGNGGFAGPGGSASGGNAVAGSGGKAGAGATGGNGGRGGDSTGGNGRAVGAGGLADGGNATAGNGGNGGPNGRDGADGTASQGAPGTVIGGGVSQFIVGLFSSGSRR